MEIGMVLFGGAAEGRHIDDSRHPLEFSSDLPILDRFQIGKVLVCADHFISINLGNCRPGRDGRLDILGQGNQLQPVEDFLPISKILGPKLKVDFDVAEAEDGEGTDIGERRHRLQGNFGGNRDGPFNLFSRPSRILGDDFDHGRRGIRVGLHVQHVKRVEPPEEEEYPEHTHEYSLSEAQLDQSSGHRPRAVPCFTAATWQVIFFLSPGPRP